MLDLQFFGGRGSSSNKKGLPLLVDGKLNPKIIDNLIENWKGNRWYKGEHDRLYPFPADLGFEIERYKSGSIYYAEVKELPDIKGVNMDLVNYHTGKISNSLASKLAGYMSDSWIDLRNGEVKRKYLIEGNDNWNFIMERLRYRILQAAKK